jgi:membrane protease YdiL (CAAX protease family)
VLAAAGALSVLTAAVLVGFQVVARPDLSALAATLPVAAFPNLVLAGVCFSILNAVMEELVYRVVFWDTVSREWNTTVALLATSVLFGLGHVHGYPPGPLGGVFAGLYGLALGLLRWWAGGLVLAVLCHISADTTIFCIMVSSGAFRTAGS